MKPSSLQGREESPTLYQTPSLDRILYYDRKPPAGAQAAHTQPGPRSQAAEAALLSQTPPPRSRFPGTRGPRQPPPFPGSCPSRPRTPPQDAAGARGLRLPGLGLGLPCGTSPWIPRFHKPRDPRTPFPASPGHLTPRPPFARRPVTAPKTRGAIGGQHRAAPMAGPEAVQGAGPQQSSAMAPALGLGAFLVPGGRRELRGTPGTGTL
ncbi:proline-rich protein 2-like [Ammospiza nelsoni]|uniref:proline-rich protein 2-like n=1 Tax=Ammospiza nelsoni TaxID=2857394 RepID=UPI002869CFC6|nr:proline-rich protein 2-like [Ammospiza nelsoni]